MYLTYIYVYGIFFSSSFLTEQFICSFGTQDLAMNILDLSFGWVQLPAIVLVRLSL